MTAADSKAQIAIEVPLANSVYGTGMCVWFNSASRYDQAPGRPFAACRGPAGWLSAAGLDSDPEHGFEVMWTVALKGQHGVGADYPVHLRQARGDHRSDLLVAPAADDGQKIPVSGDRVNLRDIRDFGNALAEFGQSLSFGRHKHDTRYHGFTFHLASAATTATATVDAAGPDCNAVQSNRLAASTIGWSACWPGML